MNADRQPGAWTKAFNTHASWTWLSHSGSRLTPIFLAFLAFADWGNPARIFGQAGSTLDENLEQYKTHPSDWRAANQIAILYTRDQQFEKAAEFYQKVVALNPGFVPARKNLAVVLWFSNRKKEAEAIFRRLLPVLPNDPVPHLYVGLADYDRKQYAAAKEHFEQAGDLAMKNPEVLPAALDTFLAMKTNSVVPSALQFVEEANAPELRRKVALVLNRYGMYDATIGVLTADRSPDAQSDALLAEAFDRMERPEQAYSTLARAIARNPADEQAYSALASFAAAHNNNDYALEVLGKGLQRAPDSAVLLLQRGLLTALSGDRERALRDLESAARANPSWILPLISRGVMELEAGNIGPSIEVFRRAIVLAPQDSNGYYFCALALSRKPEGGGEEILRLLEKALTLSPDDTKSRVLLGQTLLAQGHSRDGIAELEHALRSQPDNATALYQLALAYRRAGNTALSEQRMAAFRNVKAKNEREQTALVQVLKIIK